MCDSCKEIAGGNSLDVLEIDGASNNGVEQVRELRDNVRYAPAKGKFKIYIIDEVHMLTSAAFNALLKTLEEPPAAREVHLRDDRAAEGSADDPEPLPAFRSAPHSGEPDRAASAIHRRTRRRSRSSRPRRTRSRAARTADLRDAESMLDQLVAFCGETIAESDVLNVFGFTSEQTVADFTDKILRGADGRSARLARRTVGERART